MCVFHNATAINYTVCVRVFVFRTECVCVRACLRCGKRPDQSIIRLRGERGSLPQRRHQGQFTRTAPVIPDNEKNHLEENRNKFACIYLDIDKKINLYLDRISDKNSWINWYIFLSINWGRTHTSMRYLYSVPSDIKTVVVKVWSSWPLDLLRTVEYPFS